MTTAALAGLRGLIVGGGGIGTAAATALTEAGAEVLVADLVVAEDGIAVDVTSDESVDSAVAEAVTRMGRLDFVFANAGVPSPVSIVELTSAEWERAFAVNATGGLRVIRAAWPHLVASRGTFVATASIAATRAVAGQAAYNASKAALRMLVQTAALEGAPYGVRANSVSPGFIDTGMTTQFLAARANPAAATRSISAGVPLGRMGAPEDLAGTFVHLVDPRNAWITGADFIVDGGTAVPLPVAD
jgi:NAD(P)-dependent dehydrogenase (short-subunit alcohol dehydrogenase family)